MRFRSIIHVLSTELFGQSLAIAEFPVRKDFVGAGLSDWSGYATRLAEKLAYTNTYYHREPFLDISSKEPLPADCYDFVISSEVFEHVPQPVSRAFHNVWRILKPGGILILSVPFVEGETVEHFPELHKFTIFKEGGSWALINETTDGRRQRYDDLIFHGGPGTTVEMRLFGRDSLIRNFADAAFFPVRIHAETVEEFGILWNPCSQHDPSSPHIHGFDSQPWAARKS